MDDFKSVLRGMVIEEFASIPQWDREIDYEFSQEFIHKMNRIIRAQKRPIWNLSQGVPKKVAIVMLFLLLLF